MTFKRRTRSQAEIKRIVNQYTNSNKSVTRLKEENNLSGTDLYRMLDKAKAPRREYAKA